MIYYTLLLFFLFEYLRPGSYIPGVDALKLNAIIPVVAILGTLFGKTPVSNGRFWSETNTKLMATLLGLLVVSTLFAPVTMFAYTVTKNVFAYMLVYWVLVRQVGDVRRLKGVFMTLVVVHIMVAALNPAMFNDPDRRVGINSGSFLGDGNDFSLSVNVCVPLCLFLLLESTKVLHKLFWVTALLVLVLAVVATKSRGGTLALVAIGLYFWLKSDRKVLTAALATLAVVVVLATAPPTYFARMATMADTEESSAQGRIDAWREGTRMALRNPLLGAGAGNFGVAYGAAIPGRWVTAHSIYFLLLGELGFPGLIVLLTMIVYNLSANRRLFRMARDGPPERSTTTVNILSCTSASMLGFAAGGAFLSAAYYPHLYVVCGIMAAARSIAQTQLTAVATSAAGDATVALAPAIRPRVRSGAISPEWRPREVFDGSSAARQEF